MPTEKRERHRAGRESRREAARIAQQKAARRRQLTAVAGLLVVVVVIAFLISRSGGDDDKESVSADATTTTAAGDDEGEENGDETPPTLPAGTPGDPSTCPPEDGTPERHNVFSEPPEDCLEDGVTYTAEVKTDAGSFTIALDAEKAPTAVNNFVFLARNKYYDGVPFHRVIPDFVVQGGDGERGDGTGGPGYTFADELPEEGEYEVGSVAMANSGKDTNGSQFFVVTGPNGASLPPNYSLFGEVTKGMDVVEEIEADGSGSGTPEKTHRITSVTISEKKG